MFSHNSDGGAQLGCFALAVDVLDELGDERGPAGLMARAEAQAIVAVEILVEKDVVLEVRIGAEFFVVRHGGADAMSVAKEEVAEAA